MLGKVMLKYRRKKKKEKRHALHAGLCDTVESETWQLLDWSVCTVRLKRELD